MKKTIFFISFIFLSMCTKAQFKSLLKKAEEKINQKIQENKPGTAENSTAKSKKPIPEPSCACDSVNAIPTAVADLSSFQFDYSECQIHTTTDGSFVLNNKGNYYLLKNGNMQGPFDSNSSRYEEIKNSIKMNEEVNQQSMLQLYKEYISMVGEKYLIKFQGKSYGPYARLDTFVVNHSKDKFMAKGMEFSYFTEKEEKEYVDELDKAKTEEERQKIGMKRGMEMMQKVKNGEKQSKEISIITNIPLTKEEEKVLGKFAMLFNTSLKYDDIVIVAGAQIYDTHGRKIFEFTQDNIMNLGTYPGFNGMYLSSDNSKAVAYSDGTLSFSDGKKMSEMFGVQPTKIDGKNYLTYMYISPKHNAVMQCKFPF